MEYRIIWLPKAEERFDKIIAYLKKNWSDNEVKNFVNNSNLVINQIRSNPELFKKSRKKGIREALITKHNLLLYRVVNDQIQILAFFDNRQNPNKKYRF